MKTFGMGHSHSVANLSDDFHCINIHVPLHVTEEEEIYWTSHLVCVPLQWGEYLEYFGEARVPSDLVLSIPEGIVEHWTSVHPVCASMSVWCGCVGWFCRCVEGWMLGSSSQVQDPAVRYLFIRSHNDTYRVFVASTMKIRVNSSRSGVFAEAVHIIWYSEPWLPWWELFILASSFVDWYSILWWCGVGPECW